MTGCARPPTRLPSSCRPSSTPGARAESHMKALPRFLIVAQAAAGYALTLVAFYPGYLTNDATYVYRFMQEWSFGDWQSPLMSMLWCVIDPIAPGSGSMFLLFA